MERHEESEGREGSEASRESLKVGVEAAEGEERGTRLRGKETKTWTRAFLFSWTTSLRSHPNAGLWRFLATWDLSLTSSSPGTQGLQLLLSMNLSGSFIGRRLAKRISVLNGKEVKGFHLSVSEVRARHRKPRTVIKRISGNAKESP